MEVRPFFNVGALRRTLVIMLTTLAAAALIGCGGGSGDDAEPQGGTPAVATQAATPAANDGNDAQAPGVNMATLVLDGEVYLFALDEGGTCDPSAIFGAVFRAILTRVDEDGNQVARVGGLGMQGIDIALGLAEEAGASIGVGLDVGWSSGLEPGTSVESYAIDGNRASGSATFVSSSGTGPVVGTFEVVCE